MKRASILLGPPLAFVLAAVVGWLAGPPVGKAVSSDEAVFRSKRQREVAAASVMPPAMIAAQFENEMLIDHAPAKKFHDAEGMEAALEMDDKQRSFTGGGMNGVTYALRWAGESPAEMFQWLIRDDGMDFKRRVSAASTLFETWAEKDMETALGAVLKIPDTNLRRQAFISSLEILCKSDPDRARELMVRHLGLFSPDPENPFIYFAFDTWKTTCQLFQSLPAGAEQTHLLANLLERMASRGGDEAVHAIAVWKDAPEPVRRGWIAAGFSTDQENAASFDGLEDLAREQVEISGDPKSADQFMYVHGPDWARRDLAGALDWAQAYLKGKSRVEQSARLFEPAAGQDLGMALQVWQTLPDGNLKDRAAEAITKGAPADRKAEAESIVRGDPERAR